MVTKVTHTLQKIQNKVKIMKYIDKVIVNFVVFH